MMIVHGAEVNRKIYADFNYVIRNQLTHGKRVLFVSPLQEKTPSATTRKARRSLHAPRGSQREPSSQF